MPFMIKYYLQPSEGQEAKRFERPHCLPPRPSRRGPKGVLGPPFPRNSDAQAGLEAASGLEDRGLAVGSAGPAVRQEAQGGSSRN